MDDLDHVPIARPDDPFRALDWRWRRAGYLANLRRRPSAGDDPETMAAAAFLRRRRGRTRHRTACPEDFQQAIDAALGLAGQNGPRTWEIEARILAGQDDDEIAVHADLAPEVVASYEALFYRVRDRLAARDWIVFRAIGPGICVACRDLGQVLRTVGYFGGPIALELMIAATAPRSGAAEPASRIAGPWTEGTLANARILAAVLMLSPSTGLGELVRLREQLCRMNPLGPERGVADAVAEEASRLLGEAMPLRGADGSDDGLDQVVA